MKTLATLAVLIGALFGLAAQPALAAPNLANGKTIERTAVATNAIFCVLFILIFYVFLNGVSTF